MTTSAKRGRALRSWRLASVPTLLVWLLMGIALGLPAGLYLLQANLAGLAEGWRGSAGISVYFQPGSEPSLTQALSERLRSAEGVATVRLITSDEALDEFRGLWRPCRSGGTARRQSVAGHRARLVLGAHVGRGSGGIERNVAPGKGRRRGGGREDLARTRGFAVRPRGATRMGRGLGARRGRRARDLLLGSRGARIPPRRTGAC